MVPSRLAGRCRAKGQQLENAVSLSILESVAAVDRHAWDTLAGGNALASWGWLRTVEETAVDAYDLRYLLLHESDRLVGAALCQVVTEPRDDRIDDILFGRARPLAWRVGLSFAPAFVCGPCGTYGSHLLVDPAANASRRGEIEARLLDAVEASARAARLPVAFVHVLATQPELRATLEARGFAGTVVSPMSELETSWPSFDGYKEHVGARSKRALRTVRNELNRNRREGVTIEVLDDVEPHAERLIELLDGTSRRYGDPLWYRADFFTMLKRNLGERAIVYAARKRGCIVGTCVMLRSETDGFLTEIGVDHELAGNDFSYFNLAYYRPIQDAIATGLARLHFDNALHELKARRGCRLVEDRLFYRSPRRLRQLAVRTWFGLHTAWFRRKHAALERWT